MDNEINVKILSRNIIKPEFPTPESQKTFKLSLIDQLTPEVYGATIFFYTNNDNNNNVNTSEMSKSLQSSLSRILPRFYPLAGQFTDSSTIDCNDKGAYFFDAHVDCKLRQVLDKPDSGFLKKLLATDPKAVEFCSRAVAIFQFTAFECGGVALSASICHKMGDISTLSTFLRAWTAATANSGAGKEEVPDFIGGSLLSHRMLPMLSNVGLLKGNCRTQRFVFDGSKISALRAEITDGRQAPSRVEAVLAVLLKSAVTVSRSLSGSSKTAIFFQTVNIRSRMSPPISDDSIGNLLWQFPVFMEEKEIVLYDLIAKIRKEMSEFCNNTAPKLKGAEGSKEVMSCIGRWAFHFLTNKNIYRCSSWCRTPLYETNFGWGEPIWVSSAGQDMRNIFILMDSKDGKGIEAWITLDQKDMDEFEKNEELLEYGTLNPSV